MMKREKVDGAKIFRCLDCGGLLIAKDSLLLLCARLERSDRELLEAWRQAHPIDTSDLVRCPKCRWKMERRAINHEIAIPQDYCRKCELIWCDPGELEMHQLAWRLSEKGKEAIRLKDLHRQMTDEEKEILAERIRSLPDFVLSDQAYAWQRRRDGLGAIDQLWDDYFAQ